MTPVLLGCKTLTAERSPSGEGTQTHFDSSQNVSVYELRVRFQPEKCENRDCHVRPPNTLTKRSRHQLLSIYLEICREDFVRHFVFFFKNGNFASN